MTDIYKTSSSEIIKTIYHNGSYLLLLRRENCKVLKFHRSNSCYFQINVIFQWAPRPKASKLTRCRVNVLEETRQV